MNGRTAGKGRLRLQAKVLANFENNGKKVQKTFLKNVFVKGYGIEHFNVSHLVEKIKSQYGNDSYVISVRDPKTYRKVRYLF